ncbi:hypothetical protein Bca4012_058935 [Brassica carinata]
MIPLETDLNRIPLFTNFPEIFRPGRRYNCFEKTDVSKESNVIATNLSKNVKLMLSRFDDYENKAIFFKDWVHKSVTDGLSDKRGHSVVGKNVGGKIATLQLVDMECKYLTVGFFKKLLQL